MRYRLHRVMPMRALRRLERRLAATHLRTGSEWSARWLDRLSWFTTPYRGARLDSAAARVGEHLDEDIRYGKFRWGTTNVRWEMYRVDGPRKYRAIGLTGGTHGR